MICKKCEQDKPKIKAERRPPTIRGNNNGCYYRDDYGRLWQGNICPDCFWPKGRAYYKEATDEADMHPDRFFNPNPISHRHCRKCDKNLPISRYFYHEECAPRGISDLLEGLGGWT